MIFSMFAQRSLALEFMDTGEYTPEEYAEALHELRLVNRYMGDYWALESSLLADIGRDKAKEFSVLDIGAGSGELMRLAARFARKNKLRARVTGLELNAEAAEAILNGSGEFKNISAIQGNALDIPVADNSFDYAMCSLFTHHLTNANIVTVLKEMKRVARRGIYVIDLHRHPLAYFLYTTIGKIFLWGRLTRHDGALSILRSFKTDELYDLARRAQLKDVKVTRRFPFRLVLQASAND